MKEMALHLVICFFVIEAFQLIQGEKVKLFNLTLWFGDCILLFYMITQSSKGCSVISCKIMDLSYQTGYFWVPQREKGLSFI